ncbi:MAG TPA: acyl-CoA dehydrogenase family protein [Acidimicrobiales bacterium]|jgi:alkylation response protein AidB-like acyl-CoA dehydrogenase|nr:acyl-CoA dehydrogenase family protein [Acidimicrobiales bacterium]
MQLDFTAEQEELRDSVRAVLANECPTSVVRAHVDAVVSGESSDAGRRLWETFVGLDWQALTIAEEHGGIGLGFPELAVLAEELGRVVAPGPLLATVAGFVPLLREAEGGGPWLERVAAGDVCGAAAFDPDRVLCGGEVDVLAAIIDDHVVLVPVADAKLRPIRALDATRTLMALDPSAIGDCERLPIRPDGVERARQEMTAAIAFELVGTCESIFDTNLEYAKQRQQFGVPIGSFQAVKHKLANMFVVIERARGVCVFAAATIAESDDRRSMAVAAAKAAAGDCERLVAADGIQLLGGIGYTWEHDQQLFVKRAKTAGALFGNAAWHRQRIADALGI